MTQMNRKTLDLRDEITNYIYEEYGSKPEHLWEKYPEYEVFRHAPKGAEKGKWYCLIANVTYSQLGLDNNSDEVFYVAVVKCEPERISELVQRPGYARGYHMDKNDWISVLLDGSVSIDEAQKLVDNSFALTE